MQSNNLDVPNVKQFNDPGKLTKICRYHFSCILVNENIWIWINVHRNKTYINQKASGNTWVCTQHRGYSFLHINSVGEKHQTHQTCLMARPKCLMGDFANLYRIYKAHQTNVWWHIKVFRLHCIKASLPAIIKTWHKRFKSNLIWLKDNLNSQPGCSFSNINVQGNWY